MSGDGYGVGGTPQAVSPTTGATTATTSATAPTTGATTSNAGATPSPLGAPSGLLQADNSSSGFQLAPTSMGTNMMGTPSWADDWAKAGSPDLNSWYQQQQGGYMDMTKPQATPEQLVFAPPTPPPAAAAAPAPAAAAPAQQQGNWWTPKAGQAPAVTKNTLWGSSPVGQAELDALPDAFVASQSFLNQYGSSPSAQEYQKWRLGPEAYFAIGNEQERLRNQSMYGYRSSSEHGN
jgi:hypothetical protein